MKKRIICAAIAVLAAAALAVCFGGKTGGKPAAIQPAPDRDFMRASLTYDEGLRTLRGTQTLIAENRTGEDLEEIVLRLYMNGMDGANAAVSGVTMNGKALSFSQDADDPTVLTIDYPWQSGEGIELSWTVMLKHGRSDGAAVITLPSLAMYEDGAWRTDAYDVLAEPSYAEAFDYVIELNGEIAAQLRMARDASFVIPGEAEESVKEVSGVRIRVLACDAGAARVMLNQTEKALKSLSDAGIAYPYDALTVVQGETGREDGLALSGLIVLDADDGSEQLRRRITRLIARETFGIYVESDPWNAPWLSHTLASCAEMLAYRELRGAAAYEERLYGEMELATRLTRPAGVCVGAGTAQFGSDSEMTQVLRDQGAAMLLGIEQAVGEEAFVSALNAYVQACAMKTGSYDALCDALAQESGSSWDGYISDMLAF